MPVDSCPRVGIGLRVASDYLPDPEELAARKESATLERTDVTRK